MVRIAVQASSGAARFRVAVQAESIERALEIAKKQDLGRDSEGMFPINSEVYFAAKPVAASGSAKPGDRWRNRAVEISIYPSGL